MNLDEVSQAKLDEIIFIGDKIAEALYNTCRTDVPEDEIARLLAMWQQAVGT